jgi:hypothetical protein
MVTGHVSSSRGYCWRVKLPYIEIGHVSSYIFLYVKVLHFSYSHSYCSHDRLPYMVTGHVSSSRGYCWRVKLPYIEHGHYYITLLYNYQVAIVQLVAMTSHSINSLNFWIYLGVYTSIVATNQECNHKIMSSIGWTILSGSLNMFYTWLVDTIS